jgi:putative DNA primase/helicase
MRAEWFEFRPEFKLFMAFNHKPTIRGTDHAIWRRVRLIPFSVTIPVEEQDKAMLAKLQAEWPGILQWAVEGCLAWQQEGLKPPSEVLAATEQYRAEMDVLAGFIEECCEIREGVRVAKGKLYERYGQWCRANGEHPMPKNTFGSRLREKNFKDGHSKSSRFWEDLTLVEGDGDTG